MIYLMLFLEFFKIGLFSFGGAFGMLPLIEETTVAHGWLTESSFYSFVGVCESTPGPIAVNIATYVGSVQGGILGSICATLGVVLPSFLIILLIASILNKFTENRYFKGFMTGVDPVIAALILSTGLILLVRSFGYINLDQWNIDVISIAVFAVLTAAYFLSQKLWKKKLSAVRIILFSAVLGVAFSVISEKI